METLKQTADQFRTLFRGMTPSQRGTLLIVPLLVFGALGLLMYTSGIGGSKEYLLGGKAFTPNELEAAQSALSQAGLTDFQIDGNRISVSRGDVDRYTATLVANSSLPADFAQDFDKMVEKIGTFTTESHRRDMLDEGRKRRLSKILNAMEDVEEAIIDWDRPPTKGFRKDAIPAAQVSIRLKGGQALSAEHVRSFKSFVAGALAGVNRDQVTVTDLNTMRTVGPTSPQDAELDRVLQQAEQYKNRYHAEISKILEHIPDVLIAVNVELDPMRSTVERETKLETKPFVVQNKTEKRESTSDERTVKGEPGVGSNRPPQAQQANAGASAGNQSGKKTKETLEESTNIPSVTNIERRTEGFFPKHVSVAVSIPKDYYEKVAREDGHTEGTDEDSRKKFRTEVNLIREGIEQDIKAQVSKLIPVSTTGNDVAIHSYYREIPQPKPVSTASYLAMASDWFSRWAGTIGLGILALIAIRSLNKGMVPMDRQLASAGNPGSGSTGESDEDEEAGEREGKQAPQAPTIRDELQTMVRDNPEMAATLLNRWIVNTK